MPDMQAVRGETVEVVYTLTVDDLAALSRLRVLRRYGRWEPIFYWSFVVALLAYGIWAALSNGRSGSYWSSGSLPLTVAVLMLGLRFILGPMVARIQFRSLRLGEHPVRLVADRETLRVESGATDSRMSWSAIRKIDRTGHHFFFWINNLQAIIVPLRAFETDLQRDRLWATASQGVDANHAR